MTSEPFLDPKTQLLVALAAAAAAKCQRCFAMLYSSAEQVGASDKEVRAAVAIASKVAAKSREFMAAFIEQTTGGAAASGPDTGCGCS